MATISKQFYATRDIYKEYVNYHGFLTFEEWNKLPEDYKAAYLFVEFFDQITIAWSTKKNKYTPAEDGIETIVQYLLKNVPKIENDPNRYTPSYICSICKNCIISICKPGAKPNHDLRNKLETTNVIFLDDGTETDLCDAVDSGFLVEENSDIIRENFWFLISSLGEDIYAVANHLMDGKLLKSLRGISNENKEEAFEVLKAVLVDYQDYYYI